MPDERAAHQPVAMSALNCHRAAGLDLKTPSCSPRSCSTKSPGTGGAAVQMGLETSARRKGGLMHDWQ
jgi:hypothetical protein